MATKRGEKWGKGRIKAINLPGNGGRERVKGKKTKKEEEKKGEKERL